jgi:hypothetical protein
MIAEFYISLCAIFSVVTLILPCVACAKILINAHNTCNPIDPVDEEQSEDEEQSVDSKHDNEEQSEEDEQEYDDSDTEYEIIEPDEIKIKKDDKHVNVYRMKIDNVKLRIEIE